MFHLYVVQLKRVVSFPELSRSLKHFLVYAVGWLASWMDVCLNYLEVVSFVISFVFSSFERVIAMIL